jgi:hypothetical protein
MANDATLSFEQINQHVEDNFKPETQNLSGAASLCTIYKAVRPILVGISNFPLLPPTWKEAIRVFVNVLDSMCPAT